MNVRCFFFFFRIEVMVYLGCGFLEFNELWDVWFFIFYVVLVYLVGKEKGENLF